MLKSLQDKIVVITGASGGIGSATARAFHDAGAKVIITGRNPEKIRTLQDQLPGSCAIVSDLSNENAGDELIRKVIETFHRVDILVNNAACIIVSAADSATTDDMIRAYMTNVCNPLICMQACIRQMKQQGGGIIINVGSPGFMMGIPFYAPYVCSKAGFSALTRTLQAENDHPGIRICEYFPGYVRTPNKVESRLGDVEQDFLMKKKQNYFTRPEEPDVIAHQLLKLALKPKPLKYSSFSVQLGAFLALFPAFRIRLGRGMATTAREKLKIKLKS